LPYLLGNFQWTLDQTLPEITQLFEWTIDTLREAILKEIKVYEAGVYVNPQSLTDLPSMTAAFHTGVPPPRHKTNMIGKDRVCVYCKGAHSATNCNAITDHHKCLEYIKREGLCFNCLTKHRVAQCTSRGRCKQCSHKHHTSVCKAYVNNKSLLVHSQFGNQHTRVEVAQPMSSHPVYTNQVSNSASTTRGSNTTLAYNQTTPVTTTLACNPKLSVLFSPGDSVCLLKTAVTEIMSGKTSALAYFLFDEGAQRSFISQQFADLLQLTPRVKRTLPWHPLVLTV